MCNIGIACEIDGALDPAILEAAINQIVEVNEAPRLVLSSGDGMPRQRVLPAAYVALAVHDFSRHADAAERAHEHMRQAFREPFTSLSELLWDTQLLIVSPERCYWLHRYHHIVADGLGVTLFTHACIAAYNRLLKGVRDPPPAVPSYLDFIEEDAGYLYSPRFKRDAAFWGERYAMVPAPLFQRAVTRQLGLASPSDQVRWTIARAHFNQLTAFAAGHGYSIAHLLIAVLSVYFSRVSGADEVVIGLPVHNRTSAKLKAMFGMFSSVSPIGIAVDSGADFVQLMGVVAAELRRCYRHQRYPISELNRSLKLAQQGRRQLFDIALSYETLDAVARFGTSPFKVIAMDNGYEQTPLAIFVRNYYPEDEVTIDFNFNTSVLRRDEVQRVRKSIELLLHSVVSHATLQVGRLPLVDEQERQELLRTRNDTSVGFPQTHRLHDFFEEQARACPEAIAVEFESDQFTYHQLNRSANQLAHYLISRGVRPDAPVAICMDRSIGMVVGLMGILKAGGAYVPLDPSYPVERLAFMLRDCAPVTVLAQRTWVELVSPVDVPVLLLDEKGWAPELSRQPDTNPDAAALGLTSRHLAYIIYTSGSTGEPKGAMNEHRGIVNRLLWSRCEYGLAPDDRVLQKTPFSFDVSVWELFLPLMCGARLVMARPRGHQDPHYLSEVIQRAGITTIHFVPSMLQVFLHQADLSKCASLRLMSCSGEALSYDLQMRCLQQLPQLQLHNMYGPTEAAIEVTCWRCTVQGPEGIVPIGYPIANTQIYLLDPLLQLVPFGTAGEIYIAGVGVARGYLGRDALTAERFLHNPFSVDPDARMYKSGDLGRYLPDGSIEYLGRNDFQVKIRGCRIELGEIEACLGTCQGVRDSVVISREDSPGEKRLVAYVVPHPDAELSPAALRSQLSTALADYMLPNAYVLLSALPLTSSGKLDRRALPAPEGEAYGRRGYEAPQGEVESVLVRIWQEVLQIERVGRHDNFFELGGHSLLAVTLIERMRQRGLVADVRMLFTAASLAALAEQVGRGGPRRVSIPPNRIPAGCETISPEMLPLVDLQQVQIDRIVEQVPGGAGNVQDIYPLAPLQEGIFFHHLMSEQGDAYVLPVLLSFDTRERLDRFVEALQKVIDRHDILRTGVLWQGLPQPVQVVWRQAVLPVEEVSLEGASRAQQLRERFDPQWYRLDVRQAPLQRVFVTQEESLEGSQGRWLLLLLSHHLAIDHTTLEIAFQEVQAYLHDEQDRLSVPVGFREFVAQARLGVNAAEHEEFFRGMLGDIEEPTAPFGLLDVRGDGGGIGEARLGVEEGLSGRLREQARLLGVSAASVCHLAWAQVLSRLTGQEEVVFGTVLFGRMEGGEGVERAVGIFINTLPIRFSVGGQGVRDSVRNAHEQLGRLLIHEHATLALAQRCSGVPASVPLFTTLLNYRHTRPAETAEEPVGDSRTQPGMQVLHSQERTNYPLTLSVDDLGKTLVLVAQVSGGVDPQRICELMNTALAGLVEALEQAPQRSVRSIDVLPAAEREQVLVQWNRTQQEYPQDQCIQELFEAQVRRTPQAIAAVCGEERLTYEELNARANRLAHYLRERGVEPDTRVGICLRRSMEIVIGLLAILKAGGAYVPLDPSYPRQRLEYLLSDSEPLLLLTDNSAREVLDLTAIGIGIVDLQADEGLWSQHSSENLEAAVIGLRSIHLAYVIYTSGSTGKPKGVMVTHRNLVSSTVARWSVYGEPGRFLLLSPFGFDSSIAGIFGTLTRSGTLLIAPEGVIRDVQLLTAAIGRLEVTSLLCVPSLYQAILDVSGVPGVCEESDTLTRVIVAGEVCPPTLIAESARRAPGRVIFNEYGPTEATVWATVFKCPAEDPMPTVPIGQPIANTQLYILDSRHRPAPIGVAGEIYIGGAGVARGYLNRPELTAERFIADPFSAGPQRRLYRTGDMGRWRPDGTIEYLGRNDQQVKIRGYRIELGEIEAQLLKCSGVGEAVVLAREVGAAAESGPAEKRLVAYYTVRGEEPSIGEIRRQLDSTLAPYMVPAAYVCLERLPLTPNGKLDRCALPTPDGSAQRPREYEAPQGEIEEALGSIWQEVLHVGRVGRRDNFFDLGGHSLLAVQTVARIGDRFSITVSVRDLFAEPVLHQLALCISRKSDELDQYRSVMRNLNVRGDGIEGAMAEIEL